MNMGTEHEQLHVVLFPFMAQGHMLPTLDIARLFAARGVNTTIITTPLNLPTFTKAIENSKKNRSAVINIVVFSFPAQEAGLPEGCENLEQAVSLGLIPQLSRAAEMLSKQLEQYLEKIQPDCLVADFLFPWATDSAAKFNIPRLVFHGTSFFSLCLGEIIRLHKPYDNVSSDEEPFKVPFISHEVQLTKSQLPDDLWKLDETDRIYKDLYLEQIKESELKSFGVIVNSFYELEPHYAEFYRKELGRRAWNIGPVSMCNKSNEDKVHRGKQASISEHECLKWLDMKKPGSVIYICFGSIVNFIAPQLHEIAAALLSSGQAFIWVIKNDDDRKSEEWMPTGFKVQMEGKFLIIRGWAPQVLILEHDAIGAFVTHCGWNSTLEGITAGVPMITWPVFAEQFYNEKLVTQVLETGIPVGVQKWNTMPSEQDIIKEEAIKKALKEIMVGKEPAERRTRAKKVKELAWKAVEEGGSSYSDLSALINELRGYHHKNRNMNN